MLIIIYVKFREDRLNGFQVIERKRFCDRRTDEAPPTVIYFNSLSLNNSHLRVQFNI